LEVGRLPRPASRLGTGANGLVLSAAHFSAAALLKARLYGKALPSFGYRDFGALATIGRKRAVAQLGSVKLSGFAAWLLWSLAHIYFLIGFRNRLAVVLSWSWSYVTFQRGTRLITGALGSQMEAMQPPRSCATPMRGAAIGARLSR
jgi:NADH dehydrogenase